MATEITKITEIATRRPPAPLHVTTLKLLQNDLDDVPPLGMALTEGKRKYVDAVLGHGLHKEGVQAYGPIPLRSGN